MSLFSLNNILLEENYNSSNNDNIIDIDNIGYLDKNIAQYSFVREGYTFILEMNESYINAEKTFISNILGSYGDDNIINESFDGFFDKIKEIINKFIQWIKKTFKTFVTKINALFNSEKYLKKNSKLLQKFESQDEFEFNGYEFTNIDNTRIPAANALAAFTSDEQGKGYFDNIYKGVINDSNTWDTEITTDIADDDTKPEEVERLRAVKAAEMMNNALQKNIDNLNDNLEDFYDEFRGKVLDKSEKIDNSDYSEELFKIFRNDDTQPSDITIDNLFVQEAYRRFDKYKDTIKSIEKVQKDMIKDYEALEHHLDKLIKLNKETDPKNYNRFEINAYSGARGYVSTQIGALGSVKNNGNLYDKNATFDKMNSYLKIQSSKVNQMCAIHTQAFTAKLEAAKDCFNQDKKILYKALERIVKRSNKKDF